MGIIFKTRDVLHRITVKFFPANLPGAKKPYNLRVVHEPELDIHAIASKAALYSVLTPPEVIEEGLAAGMELMYYLAADGYKIKTPVFTLKVTVPGEYEGHETALPEGLRPHGRLTLAPGLRKYLAEKVTLQFAGIERNEGFIRSLLDRTTGETDTVLTPGGLFILRGGGLKITSDAEHAGDAGLYYEDAETGARLREDDRNIVLNEPSTLGAAACGVTPGRTYYIIVRTQSKAGRGGKLLKHVREVRSEFTVTVSTTGRGEAPRV
ncbi:MAG: DUF4469 domain-containing protein [Prevotellaceae bacterium]|jgi:hypothetical protein|nr:DUF4469 domain-containing protein [Prevotellaceae bacterium]